jgi:hypothetical protein
VEYLSQKDWEDFEKKYPDAAAFLRDRRLLGEAFHLITKQSNGPLNQYEQQRLRELKELHKSN